MGRKIELVVFEGTYYPVAAASCVFFLSLYKYVSPTLSSFTCEGYKSLRPEKQIDWNTRVNSTVHSAIVSCMCMYSLMYDNGISEDPIWCNAPMVRTSCAVVVGYMTADLIILSIHYKEIGEIFYIFHHGASMYAYYYAMTYGVLAYFANYRLIAEFSTPFVNQRWFLDALGYRKTSPIFVGNGIAMTLAFFLSRIASMPRYWLKVYSVYGTEPFTRIGHIQMVLVVTCFILDVINIYWFYKMSLGVQRVLSMLNVKTKTERNANIIKAD